MERFVVVPEAAASTDGRTKGSPPTTEPRYIYIYIYIYIHGRSRNQASPPASESSRSVDDRTGVPRRRGGGSNRVDGRSHQVPPAIDAAARSEWPLRFDTVKRGERPPPPLGRAERAAILAPPRASDATRTARIAFVALERRARARTSNVQMLMSCRVRESGSSPGPMSGCARSYLPRGEGRRTRHASEGRGGVYVRATRGRHRVGRTAWCRGAVSNVARDALRGRVRRRRRCGDAFDHGGRGHCRLHGGRGCSLCLCVFVCVCVCLRVSCV